MRVQEAPREIKIGYQPMPKQAEFHAANEKFRAFGGGFGNGKTSAGCAEGLALALEYPGSVGLIARKTRPELLSTTQHVFFRGGGGDPDAGDFTGCPQELIRSFNKSQQRLELVNGSIIHFWPLDDPDKLTNINLGWFLIDQAEETTEDMFMMLVGRLRQKRSPRKGLLLFNPNGHDWIWRRWVYLEYPDHHLTHATTYDNPNLPAEYIPSLLAQYPENWVERFVKGSFDVFSGQIWPDFEYNVHTINPVTTEPWWEIVEGIDHGRRAPTAVLWAAFFEDHGHDYCFVVDEHYEAGQLVSHHALQILNKRLEWGTPNYTVLDAQSAAIDPTSGRSVVDEYMDHGIDTIPSDRHVVARINRVAEWLKPMPDVPHPITGEYREEGYPRLYFFRNLPQIIEHVPQYQWKPQPPTQQTSAPEKPLERDDHDVDALGYILMTRPRPGKKPEPDAEDYQARRYWDRIRKNRERGGAHTMLGEEY